MIFPQTHWSKLIRWRAAMGGSSRSSRKLLCFLFGWRLL